MGQSVSLLTSLTKEAEETELAKQMVLVSCKSYDIIRSANSSSELKSRFCKEEPICKTERCSRRILL